MELQRAKGTRDFLPEDKIQRDEALKTLITLFERYGFNPMETPVIERYDVLASKYSGGAEILKETFKLTDQGGRDLALRYDLTVPLARVIATQKGIKIPFKRYQIGPVYRDGPLKLGRYREFTQCDVDIIGCKDITADVECLNIARDAFKALHIPVTIKLNNIALLKDILLACGVKKNQLTPARVSIDKLEKIGKEEVTKELKNHHISSEVIEKLYTYLFVEGSNEDKTKKIQELGDFTNLQTIIDTLHLANNAVFTPSLSRGLAYYTGNIFEVYGTNTPVKSSLAGGGRYDTMIGDFIGTGTHPAVGISFGLAPILDCMPPQEKKSVVTLYVIPILCFPEAYAMVKKLRDGGVNVDIDLMGRGISKNLEYAHKHHIPYAGIVGKEELKHNKMKLKNMITGEEHTLTLNEIFKKLQHA